MTCRKLIFSASEQLIFRQPAPAAEQTTNWLSLTFGKIIQELSFYSSPAMSTHSIYQTESWYSSDGDEGSVYSSNTVNQNLFLKDTKRQVASISQKLRRSVSGLIGTERKRLRRHSRRASGGNKNDESMKFYQQVQGHTDVGSRRRLC